MKLGVPDHLEADKRTENRDNRSLGGDRLLEHSRFRFSGYCLLFFQSVVHSSSITTRNVHVAGMSMNSPNCRRKPDLFSALILAVALGMTATVAYQVNIYYGGDQVPIAKQTPPAIAVGG